MLKNCKRYIFSYNSLYHSFNFHFHKISIELKILKAYFDESFKNNVIVFSRFIQYNVSSLKGFSVTKKNYSSRNNLTLFEYDFFLNWRSFRGNIVLQINLENTITLYCLWKRFGWDLYLFYSTTKKYNDKKVLKIKTFVFDKRVIYKLISIY